METANELKEPVMPYYRKITNIEARQFDPVNDMEGAVEVMGWAGMKWAKHVVSDVPDDSLDAIVYTLEDGANGQVKHYVSAGDWVVKGQAGEFYAIKPDIFHNTYELA